MVKQVFIETTLREQMAEWRRGFHRHPELGCEETRTSQTVADLLRQFGVEVHAGIGGTGVVGVLKRGSSSRSIGLRAEMDGLAIQETNTFAHRSQNEGRMHACGHDGHMVMLLGAAQHLAASRLFDGTVYFIFQPGEEPGLGARAMLRDGLFEKFPADSIYALHNMPSLVAGTFAVSSGPVMACEDHFEIVIDGKGAHSAMPHLGTDPIPIGAEVVLGLQAVISRALDPIDRAVLSVTEFVTDGSRNVLPGKVSLKGDTRSFLPEVSQTMEDSMCRVAQGICAAHGAGCEFTYSRQFVATVNSDAEAEWAAEAARQVVGEKKVLQDCSPFMASEDFGFFLQEKPGCFLFIGNGEAGGASVGLHNPGYDFNDLNLAVGAEFWIRLVAAQLPTSYPVKAG